MEHKKLDTDKTRCKECGFGYYTHEANCPVMIKQRIRSDVIKLITGKSVYFVEQEDYA